MARCRCLEGGQCGCFLGAGDGITVTGSGNSGAPWIVSATPRSTGTIDVVDTLTLDLTLEGNGTPGDRYLLRGDVNFDGSVQVADTPSVNLTKTVGPDGEIVLSADATVAGSVVLLDSEDLLWTVSGTGTAADPLAFIGDVPCLACEQAGNVGDVLTLDADGVYRPGPPTTAPVGAVSTGVGLTGDGSAGAPLAVAICTYADLEAVCGTP